MSVSVQPAVFAANARPLESWTGRLGLVWQRRRLLLRVFLFAAPLSVCIVLLIPRQYESAARIMPPDNQNSAAPMLAALASRVGGMGTLGTLAGGLLGTRPTTGLFENLLQSSTVTGHLVDRFHLQSVYHSRYAVDAAKRLANHTQIEDDKKSGVITIVVEDRDPIRARDMTQAYLDELNDLVVQTSNSSAHQERIFVERRLRAVTADLERAQNALSEYASRNNAIDLKEQTRAMVDAGARVEATLLLEQSTLNSLRQVYGDQNIRVREAEARIATLHHELDKVAGSSDSTTGARDSAPGSELYPALRQLPRLAVPYADLYRNVRVQETLYELLTQQYESARIEEAKNIPAVAVIDRPGVPDKKSFPPRTLLVLLLTCATLLCTVAWILLSERWAELPANHDARRLFYEIRASIRTRAGETR